MLHGEGVVITAGESVDQLVLVEQRDREGLVPVRHFPLLLQGEEGFITVAVRQDCTSPNAVAVTLERFNVDALEDLADDGVDLTAVRWCIHPTMGVLLHSVVDAANRPVYDGRTMFGLPVHVSANVPSGKVLVGDWRQLVMPMWGRVEISRSKSVRPDFTERFRSIALANVAIIRPSAFSVGSVSSLHPFGTVHRAGIAGPPFLDPC